MLFWVVQNGFCSWLIYLLKPRLSSSLDVVQEKAGTSLTQCRGKWPKTEGDQDAGRLSVPLAVMSLGRCRGHSLEEGRGMGNANHKSARQLITAEQEPQGTVATSGGLFITRDEV